MLFKIGLISTAKYFRSKPTIRSLSIPPNNFYQNVRKKINAFYERYYERYSFAGSVVYHIINGVGHLVINGFAIYILWEMVDKYYAV